MAHHKSAKKRIRQTNTRTELNKSQSSKARTVIKALNNSIVEKNKEVAAEKFLEVQSLLRKLAKKGIIKLGQASRKTSRLQKQVNSL